MITVKELLKACQEQVKNGNGDKVIIVADDNEGNNYHGLEFLFTDDINFLKDVEEQIYDTGEDEINNLIILG